MMLKANMDQDSAEGRLNGDGDKEILAPAEGPRENLISTAVKFLQNPKVSTSPLYQKKAFLEKKGLTQEEINIAVERSGVKETNGSDVATAPVAPPAGYHPGMMGGASQVPPPYVAIPPQSGWAKARDLTMTTVIVASVSYAVYQVFQTYLRPLLFGKSGQEKRLERLEGQILEIQKSVSDSLAEVTRTLTAIQTTMNNQQTQYNMIGNGEMRGVSDLRADIASLKGLLLNRNQFPPAPATSPILPAWQRAQLPAATKTEATTVSSTYADVVKTSVSGQDENSVDLQNQILDTSSMENASGDHASDPASKVSHMSPPQENGIAEGSKDGLDISGTDHVDSSS